MRDKYIDIPSGMVLMALRKFPGKLTHFVDMQLCVNI